MLDLFEDHVATDFFGRVAELAQKTGKDLNWMYDTKYRPCLSEEDLMELDAELAQAKYIAIDTETTGLVYASKVVGIPLSTSAKTGWYIPVRHKLIPNLDSKLVHNVLQPHFLDLSKKLLFFNGGYDCPMLQNFLAPGIGFKLDFQNIIDVFIMLRLQDPDFKGGLKDYTKTKIGVDTLDIKEIFSRSTKNKKTGVAKLSKAREADIDFTQVQLDDALAYAVPDSDMTLRLYELLVDSTPGYDFEDYIHNVEHSVLAEVVPMRHRGLYINQDVMAEAKHSATEIIRELRANIAEVAGPTFNPNSPKDLAKQLYDVMGLSPLGYTKTGAPSTDKDALDQYRASVPFVDHIATLRESEKLVSAFIDKIPTFCDVNSVVHPSFNQNGTASGRFTCTDPNFQQIPKPKGSVLKFRGLIRKAVQARPGYTLIDADYSQIEYRVFASLSGDESLKQAYRDGLDFHAFTAASMFGIPLEKVTPELRQRGKTLNFGLLFGMSPYGLAIQLGISEAEAKDMWDAYFADKPRVGEWRQEVHDNCKKTGYVWTYFGRRRRIWEIFSKDRGIYNAGLRKSVNTTVQGCIHQDEYLWTKDGLIPIKSAPEFTQVFDGYGYSDAHVFPTGEKQEHIVHFKHGTPLHCSDKQLFLTWKDDKPYWAPIPELTEDTWVAQPNHVVDCEDTVNPTSIELLGALMGDGYIRYQPEAHKYELTLMFHPTKEAEVIGYYENLLTEAGYEPKFYVKKSESRLASGRQPLPELRWNSKPLATTYSLWFGEIPTSADNKFVPEIVFRQSASTRAKFVRALFNADGGFDNYRKENPALVFTTASERLAEDVVKLLASLNIRSHVVPSWDGVQQRYYSRVTVSDVAQFLAVVGFISTYKQQAYACHPLRLNQSEAVCPNLRKYAVEYLIDYTRTNGISRAGDHQQLNMLRKSGSRQRLLHYLHKYGIDYFDDILNFKWTKIEKVEKTGKLIPTYDVSLLNRESSHFVCGTILTHNTAADILKIAMIRVGKAIRSSHFDAHLIATVHDELLVEVRTDQVEEFLPVLRTAMEIEIPDFVPIIADIEIGNNWLETYAPEDWDYQSNAPKNAQDSGIELVSAPSAAPKLVKLDKLSFTIPEQMGQISFGRFKQLLEENRGTEPYQFRVGITGEYKESKNQLHLSASLIQNIEALGIIVQVPESLLAALL